MAKKYTMYPRRTVDFSNPYHFVRKEKDYIGFYCNSCFNPMVFRASVTMNIQNVDKDATSHISMTPCYNVQCPVCGNLMQFKDCLDPNITPMIAELNRKGYETIESCEGHRVNQDDVSLPYISFKYPEQKNVIKYIPLQGPWYLDDNNDAFIIRCKDVSIPIRERMAYLRRWVNALPYCFEEAFSEEMFTIDTKEAIAYKQLNRPLDPEDITVGDEFDIKDDDSTVVNDPNRNTGKRTYSSKEEIKHRNDPDWEPSNKLTNTKPHKQFNYSKPRYNNHGKSTKAKQQHTDPHAKGKVSTYTNKQKKNKPVWNSETKKQEYK